MPIATPLSNQEHDPLAIGQVVAAVVELSKYRDTIPEAAVGETVTVPVKDKPSVRLVLLVTLSVVVVEAFVMLSNVPLEMLVPSKISPP